MSSELLAAPPAKKGTVDWDKEYAFADAVREAYWKSQEPQVVGQPNWKARLSSMLNTASKGAEEAFLGAEAFDGDKGRELYMLGIFYQGIVTHGGR